MDSFNKGEMYFNIYQKIFQFHKRFVNATTLEEWTSCTNELPKFHTPFESAMAVAVVEEIERNANKKPI